MPIAFLTGGTDAAELAKAGIRAVSVVGMDWSNKTRESVYHTPDDTIGSVETRAIEAAIRLGVRFVEEIEAGTPYLTPPVLHQPLVYHRVGHLLEAGDVGADHVVALEAVLAGALDAGACGCWRMISCRRRSTSSALQARRIEFWLISRPEVATPPALAALPGAKGIFFSTKSFQASAVQPMLEVSTTALTPFAIRVPRPRHRARSGSRRASRCRPSAPRACGPRRTWPSGICGRRSRPSRGR